MDHARRRRGRLDIEQGVSVAAANSLAGLRRCRTHGAIRPATGRSSSSSAAELGSSRVPTPAPTRRIVPACRRLSRRRSRMFNGTKIRADRAGGEQRLQERRMVRPQVGHPVPRAAPPVPQGVGQPVHPVGELAVADAWPRRA